MLNVFIDGSVGTTGLRIEERLSNRSELTLHTLPEQFRKDALARKDALNSADLAFLCLPDSAAVEAVQMVDNPSTKIVDTSTAHRTAEGWTYGFPELDPSFAQVLCSAKRVAVPGCHASGFLSIVYPLVKMGLIPTDYPLTCFSLTGYSGGGKKMIAEYRDSARSSLFDAPRQYALSQTHKHLPEMQLLPSLDFAPVFSPIVADYYSGMQVSVPLFGSMLCGGKGATKAQVFDALSSHYQGSEVVSVCSGDDVSLLSALTLSGKDSMRLYVFGCDERIEVVSLFDNLGKGASGAAVQCMNIMCGFAQTAGLSL